MFLLFSGTKMLFSKFFVSILISMSFFVNTSGKDTVILVSFDGFRWDYLDMNRTNTENFDSIIQEGVRAEYVQNVFPTVTFPNHYTILTGQYAESHGIISNSMYDPVLNENFSMDTNDSKWWNTFSEPLWITNQNQGHKSGMCYWPGYDVEYKGQNASYTTSGYGFNKPFLTKEGIMPWKERVDVIIKWLKEPDPPSFVTLYFNSPDDAGHCCGPYSVNVTEEIRKDDKITGYLLEQLRKEKILDEVNLIITADHGTGAYNTSTIIDCTDYLTPDLKFWAGGGTFFFLHADNVTRAYNKLKERQKLQPHFSVFYKEEVPDDLHIKHSNRVPEIVVIMDEYWIAEISKAHNTTASEPVVTKGAHGWVPSIPSMRPFFIARGPAFKVGHKFGHINMVDIYPLICHLLGIKPAPNNGSLDRIAHLLKSTPRTKSSSLNTGEIIALLIGTAIGLTVCMYAVIMVVKDRRLARGQRRPGEVDVPLIDGELYGDQEDDNVI